MRIRNLLSVAAAALVGAAVLGSPTRADAAFELRLSEDGGAPIVVNVPSSTGPAIYSGLVGSDFLISLSVGTSNSPGGLNGLVQDANITIQNLSGSSHVLHISASAQDFTSPNSPPPLYLLDTVSGTLVNGSVSGNFQGFADASNALFGTGFAGQNLLFSAAGLSQSISGNGSAFGFSPNGNPYSISIFANFTIGGGSLLTLTGGNAQTAAAPAPAALVLALTGLPVFGVAGWIRRRRAVTA